MSEWEDVTGNTISMTNEDGTPGKVIEGIFEGTTSRPDREDPNKLQYQHHIDIDGVTTSIYGTGQLNYLMNSIPPGTLIRITYMGKEKVEGYKKKLHQFKVQKAKAKFEENDEEMP